MSLAWRILLVVLLLNFAVVGGLQTALFAVHVDWMQRWQSELVDTYLVPFLLRNYSAERLADATQVRELVRSPELRDLFADVVVTRGRPTYSALVFLNPHGAVHRDPDLFSMRAIQDGMQLAEDRGGPVRVGDGYCRAVRLGDELAGYLWYVPRERVPDAWPWWVSLVTVLAGTLLFGALLYWIVARTIGRPLHRIGETAAQVGAGAYGSRLPALRGLPELDAVVRSFNTMAEKVQGHTRDLQRAVEAAVAATEEKQRALVLSSRLAAIGTLAAGIAHEINNPIGGMQNAVNRLLQNDELSDRQRKYLQLVLDGLQRIARTSRRVLDFSPRSVEAAPFPIAAAIDGARALTEHRLQQQGVAFAADLAPDLPEVSGDAHEIQQVLLNLFLNSLDAFGQQARGGHLTVTADLDGRMVRVVVADDGPGMDPADLARVLDPFFSKKDRPDASGLGMFISYSIVQNHGGDMQIWSEPGRGFRVTLTLPAANPDESETPAGGADRETARPADPGRERGAGAGPP